MPAGPRVHGSRKRARAYNPRMFDTLQRLASVAFMERATLWINHVLSGEEAATRRLQTHAGRCITFQMNGWPSLLPPLPRLSFVVTPAGLLEWSGNDSPVPADLDVSMDASNPALAVLQGLAGRRPAVEVAGDAELASDVSWLMANLRWDAQDDLARLIGPGPAHELARVGSRLASGFRDAIAALADLASRSPARPPGGPPDPRAR